MGENYAVVIAEGDGQAPKRIDLPKKYYIIEYENDNVYITPEESPYWYVVYTTPERCGTFKLTVSDEVYEDTKSENQKTGETKVRILPGFSVDVYKKNNWNMNFVGNYIKESNDYILLDLQYGQTYYIRHRWIGESESGVFKNSITCYYDKIAMTEAAVWAKETPNGCYHNFEATPRKPAIPMYRQVIYLDKGQVPNFINIFYKVHAVVNSGRGTLVTLKDVVTAIAGAVMIEMSGAGFFSGIAISLLVTGGVNALEIKVRNDNGDILTQIENFENMYIKEQIRETTTNTVVRYSDAGMKISIKDYTMQYPSDKLAKYVDCSLIEAWDKNTGISRVVEGPKYYRGRFKVDNEILGENMGFTVESLKDVFGIE